jgi:hypothetical protein
VKLNALEFALVNNLLEELLIAVTSNLKPGEYRLTRLRELKDHDLLQNNGGAAESLIKEP